MVGVSTDYWVALTAVTDLARENSYLKAEIEGLGLHPVFSHDSGLMHYGFKDPVYTLAEMDGKLVRTYGGSLFEAEERMGMEAVFMGYADIYEAMARGTIDGTGFTYTVSDGFKHWEVVNYVVEVGAGYSLGPQRMMRLELWNTLPADIQNVFTKLEDDWVVYFSKVLMEEEVKLREKWRNYGVTINVLTPEDQDKLDNEILPEAQEAFLVEVEGMPGGEHARDVWAQYQELRDKYQAEVDAQGYPWER